MTTVLEVSLGEALDKLTILDIKRSKIKDHRRADVETEYTYLQGQLQDLVSRFPFYYRMLYETNLWIWEEQDKIRDGKITEAQRDLCFRNITDWNDSRFLLKNKINLVAGSKFREQKGYTLRTAVIVTHLGLGDHLGAVPLVRYLSLYYDNLYVVCKPGNQSNVSSFYADDPTIIVEPLAPGRIETEAVIIALSHHPRADHYTTGACWRHLPLRITHSYLQHLRRGPHEPNFIRSFYTDVGLDFAKLATYFYLPAFTSVKVPTQRVVFLQTISSSHQLHRPELWDAYLHDSSYLVVDPNRNHYPPEHPLFAAAQSFVNLPCLAYVELLRVAEVICVIDSAFFCLAGLLPLRAHTKLCFFRSDQHYTDFNSDFQYQSL